MGTTVVKNRFVVCDQGLYTGYEYSYEKNCYPHIPSLQVQYSNMTRDELISKAREHADCFDDGIGEISRQGMKSNGKSSVKWWENCLNTAISMDTLIINGGVALSILMPPSLEQVEAHSGQVIGFASSGDIACCDIKKKSCQSAHSKALYLLSTIDPLVSNLGSYQIGYSMNFKTFYIDSIEVYEEVKRIVLEAEDLLKSRLTMDLSSCSTDHGYVNDHRISTMTKKAIDSSINEFRLVG